MAEIDFNAVDHFDEVAEYLGVPTTNLSYQDRTECGQHILRLAARRLVAEQAEAEKE